MRSRISRLDGLSLSVVLVTTLLWPTVPFGRWEGAAMSSFVGHALAPLIAYRATEPEGAPPSRSWPLVLVALGLAPDVDYLLGGLILPGARPVRVTHSLLGSLVLPAAVVLAGMLARRWRRRRLALRGGQAAAAGLSHVALDLLVGVTPAALLWPLSNTTFRLPGGVLPSAGRLDPGNPYLYRNLLLEMGVLLPLLGIVHLLRSNRSGGRKRALAAGALAAVSLASLLLSASLSR
ncbi:MAG TPA: metal-dependent hydrolase [Longimicrobium sp.]|nr:metal-dependent hydrolase [Longimicrobium sp.]